MAESKTETQVETLLNEHERFRCKVIHVDDDPAFLKIAKECLEMQGGFQVEAAGCVEEAMDKLGKEEYDAIVSDYQTPGKNGLEFLKELRDEDNDIPFIIFTGKGKEELAVKALNLGADGYFDKHGDAETVYCELAHGILLVVEKRKAKMKALSEEERLRAVLSSSPDAITVSDLNGNIVDCNEAAVKLAGISSKESIIGKNSFEFISEKDRKRALENLKKTIEQGIIKNTVYSLLKIDGKEYQGELSASILKDSHGNPAGFVAVVRDITERIMAEDALRKNEEKLRVLLENLPQKIFFKDRNSVYISCNGNYARDLRISPDQIAGKTDYDFYPKQLAEKYRADDKRIMESGHIEDIEEEYTQDGQSVYVHTVKTPVKDENGKVVGILGIFRDITERKKAEELARASEERYRSYIDLAGQLGWTTNAYGEVEEDVPAWRRFTGQSYEEVKGWGWTKALHPDDLEHITQTWEKAVAAKSAYEVEYRIRRHDGIYRHFLIRGIPVLKENGSIREWVGTCIDITERRKAGQSLKESEEKYRGLVELAPDGIVAVNAEGVVTSANRSFLTLVGYDSEEGIVGKPFTELMTMRMEDIPRFQGMFMSLMKGESPAPSEFLYVRRDGTSRWAEVHPGLLIKDGNPVGAQAIMRDVTERKNAEKLIQDNQQKFEQLFMSSPEAAAYVDPNERVLNVNPRFTELFGYSFDEIKGKFLDDFVVPEDRRKEALMLAQKGRKRYVYYETVRKNKEGSLIPVTLSSAPIVLQGQHIGNVVLYKDITERKALEDALRDAKQKWTSLTENTDDIVMIVDSEGIIQYINRTIPPYTPEGTIGKTVYEYVPREQHDTLRSSLKKAFEMGVPLSYVVSSNIPKIGTVWFETKIVPVKDDEKTVSAILMSIDITELKNTEERLKETNMKLVVTNEKLRVVGGLTRHDVRNKLSAMTGNAYLLRQKLVGDAKALEQLKDMEAAVRLVEKIFEFAGIYEKLGTEQLVNIDVGKVVDEAALLFSDLKGVKIVNECRGLTVLADSLLKQLFYNLIDNSLKYGGKTGQIRVYYKERSADHLELVYEDDGVGIPSDMRSNLFNEGFTSGKGTGYGLFMIRRICEVYGWTIEETGKQGKGVQFTMSIPRIDSIGKARYQIQKPRQHWKEPETNAEVPNTLSPTDQIRSTVTTLGSTTRPLT